ncbi:MAG: YbhB/YbcL family Raf kinase inhibitor-like protein [Planctomycetota bacterium]
MVFEIRSRSFEPQAAMPKRFTQDDENIAPELSWSSAPQGTKSLALIVSDPDAPDPAAPKMTYVHWVAYNLPSTANGIPEGGALPRGAKEGRNDAGGLGYVGPAPPKGRHRYFFKLYALDAVINGLDAPTKKELEAAMKGHVIGEAQIVGTYKRAEREAA